MVDCVACQRRKGIVPEAEPLPAFSSIRFPKGLFLADNHSWARLTELGELKVGMDELLTQALGDVSKVDVMPVGTRLAKGDPLAVVTRLGHKFQVTSPVAGTLVAANENTEVRPDSVNQDPYGRGWLATIWPVEHNEALRDMRVGDRAATWLGREVQRFSDFLTVNTSPDLVGSLAADGAHPLVGAACSLDEEGWRLFQEEFASIR